MVVKIDRYAVMTCDGGYDIWDCLHQKQVYGHAVQATESGALQLCENLITTTGERKSVWVVVTPAQTIAKDNG